MMMMLLTMMMMPMSHGFPTFGKPHTPRPNVGGARSLSASPFWPFATFAPEHRLARRAAAAGRVELRTPTHPGTPWQVDPAGLPPPGESALVGAPTRETPGRARPWQRRAASVDPPSRRSPRCRRRLPASCRGAATPYASPSSCAELGPPACAAASGRPPPAHCPGASRRRSTSARCPNTGLLKTRALSAMASALEARCGPQT